MNQFFYLCKLASDENWCWKLCCTTCGHMHFRYAFAELAAGKSPDDANWIIHRRNKQLTNTLGSFPSHYSEEQKAALSIICSQASIRFVVQYSKFPDWLGYLGLVLEHMYSNAHTYSALSKSWAAQLAELIASDTALYARLTQVAEGSGLLNIHDLESCESNMMHRRIHT
jgi:hypothetical protein